MSKFSISNTTILRDPSLWLLLIANIYTVTVSFSTNAGVFIAYQIFLAQCAIIGFFSILRLLYPGHGIQWYVLNIDIISSRKFKKYFSLIVFNFPLNLIFLLMFYGIAVRLLKSLIDTQAVHFAPWKLLVGSGIFLICHLVSYVYFRDKEKTEDIIIQMITPYARTLPMLAVLLTGIPGTRIMLVLYLGFKTLADIGMHIIEHQILRVANKRPLMH